LVALFLFQLGSGVYLATHSDVRPMDRFRTFQIASGIFLAAYVLGHGDMNSVFVFARLYLGTRWMFQASLTDPDGAPWRDPVAVDAALWLGRVLRVVASRGRSAC
jgi:hypothetical protein